MPNISNDYQGAESASPISADIGTSPQLEYEKIYFHGGCKNNHQKDKSKRVMNLAVYMDAMAYTNIKNYGSNNEAPFYALIYAAELALAVQKANVIFLGHCEAVTNLVAEIKKAQSPAMKELLARFRRLSKNFSKCQISYIPYTENLAARIDDV